MIHNSQILHTTLRTILTKPWSIRHINNPKVIVTFASDLIPKLGLEKVSWAVHTCSQPLQRNHTRYKSKRCVILHGEFNGALATMFAQKPNRTKPLHLEAVFLYI